MRPRTVFVSCLAGLLASLGLAPIFTNLFREMLSSQFAWTGWRPGFVLAEGLFVCLILVAGGYVSARLEWAPTARAALSHGLNAGLLAGCLLYLFSGVAAASGLWGQKEILLSLAAPLPNENAGMLLLTTGIIHTTVWTQAGFWASLLLALLAGGLGGLLSRLEPGPGWWTAPQPKRPELERLVVYTLGASSLLQLTVTMAVLNLMPDLIEKALLKIPAPIPGGLGSPQVVLILPVVTACLWLLVCTLLACQWAVEAWRAPRERFRVKVWLGLTTFLLIFLFLIQFYLGLGVTLVFCLLLLGFWAFWPEKGAPQPPAEADGAYNLFDFLASGLAQGILSSALSTGLLLASSLALVLISVVDIPHLTVQGVVKTTAQVQIGQLYSILASANLVSVLLGSLIGLVIAAIGGATGMLRSAPVPAPEAFNVQTELENEA